MGQYYQLDLDVLHNLVKMAVVVWVFLQLMVIIVYVNLHIRVFIVKAKSNYVLCFHVVIEHQK